MFPFPDDVKFKKSGTVSVRVTDKGIELVALSDDPPTPPSGTGMLYVKASNKHLYYIDSGGTKTDITAAAGGGVPSSPASGEYRITNIRMGADKRLKIDYDPTPEP